MTTVSYETLSTVVVAAMTHQVFRRYETYYPSVHFLLLLGPPTLLAFHFAGLSNSPHTGVADALRWTLPTFLGALGASVVVYRLSPFHPLAQYPGPFLYRISRLVGACAAMSGDRSKRCDAFRRQYGDVVRTGPNELTIFDPSLIAPLLGPTGLPKGPSWMGGSLSYKHLPMVGIPDTDLHLKRRRPWNRALAPTALKEYELFIARRASQLLQRLEEQAGAVILGEWLNYFSYDFMSDMAFGGGSELLRDGDKDHVWAIIANGMRVATFFGSVPWLGILVGYIPGAAGPLKTLHARGGQLVANRLARGSSSRDLFYYLSNEDLVDKDPPLARELIDDANLAIVAGSDTTTIVLTSIFFCLLTNPEAYATLMKEIDEFYPLGADPYATEHHRSMPYLHAVINETLRLYPPVPGGGERRLPHEASPLPIGSVCIPPGTSIWIPPWSLGRDERNFTYPTAFWPERWLIASGQLELEDARIPSASAASSSLARSEHACGLPDFVHNEDAFIPFSYGPMVCAGKGLAMLEMRVVVTALLQCFHLRLQDGWDPAEYEKGFKDYFNATRPPLPVVLQRRF